MSDTQNAELKKAGNVIHNNTALEKMVDTLDGKEGSDVTGSESKILKGILSLESNPLKLQEAIKRMSILSGCNTELQCAYQKQNLLAGIDGADIDRTDILDTIKKLERKKLRVTRFAEMKDNEKVPGEFASRQEILKQHTGLETVRASDILMLKKK